MCFTYFVSGRSGSRRDLLVERRCEWAVACAGSMCILTGVLYRLPGACAHCWPSPRSGGSFTVCPSLRCEGLVDVQQPLHPVVAGLDAAQAQHRIAERAVVDERVLSGRERRRHRRRTPVRCGRCRRSESAVRVRSSVAMNSSRRPSMAPEATDGPIDMPIRNDPWVVRPSANAATIAIVRDNVAAEKKRRRMDDVLGRAGLRQAHASGLGVRWRIPIAGSRSARDRYFS